MFLTRSTGHAGANTQTTGDTMSENWTMRENVLNGSRASLIGYDVETTEGSIGEVTEESTDVVASFIVVDTGFWILEKKRLIPAAAISGIDHDTKTLRLDMTKDEIKNAPDYVAESQIERDVEYRDAHDRYYQPYFGVRP